MPTDKLPKSQIVLTAKDRKIVAPGIGRPTWYALLRERGKRIGKGKRAKYIIARQVVEDWLRETRAEIGAEVERAKAR